MSISVPPGKPHCQQRFSYPSDQFKLEKWYAHLGFGSRSRDVTRLQTKNRRRPSRSADESSVATWCIRRLRSCRSTLRGPRATHYNSKSLTNSLLRSIGHSPPHWLRFPPQALLLKNFLSSHHVAEALLCLDFLDRSRSKCRKNTHYRKPDKNGRRQLCFVIVTKMWH